MDADMMNDFLQEARDLLDTTDEKLVALEKAPADQGLLNAVFRGYHTIKGGAGFMELHGLVRLCHALETLFDALRSNALTMNAQIMDASLMASNEIRRAMGIFAVNAEAQYTPPPDLIVVLEQLATGEVPQSLQNTVQNSTPTIQQVEIKDQSNDSEPHDHLESIETAIDTPNTTGITNEQWIAAHQLFTNSPVESSTDPVSVGMPPPASKGSVASREVSPPPTDKTEKETQIKVDTNRLDSVLTLASEVGLAKNRVIAAKNKIIAQDFSEQALSDLDRAVNDLDRLSTTLQNAVMLTRMQPIGRLFSKYPRIVRDLARSLGKKIEIELSGHETEIDKGMIEDLADPLIHLIRNSSDHGIETPDVRFKNGKPETGTIWLSAKQEGDRILIEIRDDGKGIDPSFIRQKAKEKGLMDPASIDALNDQEALELIMMPGFSTAEKLSSVSGRGVGMDVVKTNIQKMGGEIHIQSNPGTGTQMSIRIPLTLAVLPVLLLRSSNQPLALPLGMVQEIVSLAEHVPQPVGSHPVINLRGEILKVWTLSSLLGWDGADLASNPVAAIVDIGNGRKCALAAQGFIGREEVMVKALEGSKPKGVSGVMVDAQGDIVLILDLKELVSGVIKN